MKTLWIKQLLVLAGISTASLVASLPQGWSAPEKQSEGRDEALRICDQLNSLSQRDDCRTLVGQTRTFTVEAVLVCGSMDYEPSQTASIRWRKFNPARAKQSIAEKLNVSRSSDRHRGMGSPPTSNAPSVRPFKRSMRAIRTMLGKRSCDS